VSKADQVSHWKRPILLEDCFCSTLESEAWQSNGRFQPEAEIMFHRIPLFCFAALVVISPLSLPAEQPATSIQILATFDYPAANNFTITSEINEEGDLAGSYIDANGLQRGFVRFHNGSFSRPIVPPFDVGSFTGADDINDAKTICGFFSSTDDTVFHGYFRSGGSFTQFDVDGALSTFVTALNDTGDFVGSFDSDPETTQAFVDIGGILIHFSIPDASFTGASSINGPGETVGNYRIGTETANHGFFRDELGNLNFPIDFPGSLGPAGTVLRGINDRGWVVGGYFDQNSVEHGFLFRRPSSFLSFDYPDALSTRLSGINKADLVCGSYVDGVVGAHHGFIGRLR
jgi:hypothetical protein